MKAAIQTRAQGLVRFIGVTGHCVEVARFHRRSLEQFDFDSVLLLYSFPMTKNSQYAADFEKLVAICQKRNVAIQTIKGIAHAPWGDRKQTAAPWYEPLRDQGAIGTAVIWVLGRESIFLKTVGDIHVLPKVLNAAERFTSRLSDEEMATLLESWQMEPLFT